MSRVYICFVGIENYVLGSSFSQSTFQKGGDCMYIRDRPRALSLEGTRIYGSCQVSLVGT